VPARFEPISSLGIYLNAEPAIHRANHSPRVDGALLVASAPEAFPRARAWERAEIACQKPILRFGVVCPYPVVEVVRVVFLFQEATQPAQPAQLTQPIQLISSTVLGLVRPDGL